MSTVTPPRSTSSAPGGFRSSGARPAPRAASIDPFRVLRRHLLLIVAAFFVGGGLGTAAWIAFMYLSPLYEATAVLQVQEGVSTAGELSTRQRMDDEAVMRVAKSESTFIVSREVLSRAARRPEVQRTAWFQKNFVEGGQPLVDDAVDELIEDVVARPVRGTNLFEVRWLAHARADAPVVVNAIIDAYIALSREQDDATWNRNLEAFNTEVNDVNTQIRNLQTQTDALILESGITSLDDTRYGEAAKSVERIVEMNAQTLGQLEAGRVQLQQVQAKLRGDMRPSQEDIREAEMTDQSVASHIRTLNELNVELRTLRGQYPEDHHLVRKAESRRDAAQAELEAQRDSVIRRNLAAAEKNITDMIAQLEAVARQQQEELDAKGEELRSIAQRQSEYRGLEDRRTFLEQAREQLLNLQREVRMLKVREDARKTRMLTPAQEPRELYFPKPEIVVPLGVLLVVGFVVGLVFLLELSDQRVKTASDLLVVPGASVLGVIPDIEEDPTGVKSPELVVRRSPQSVTAESWREAATAVQRGLDRAGHMSLVVLGGLPGSGTTTAVTNIAASIAAGGRRVVVVDGNFRRPRVAEVLGLDAEGAGLGEVLAGRGAIEDVLHATDAGFDAITAGHAEHRVVERLGGEAMASALAALRGRYDVILVDAPPAVVAGDAMAIAHRVDAAMLVVRANHEERGLVSRLLGNLERARCEVIGIVLNRPRRTAGGYFRKNFRAMAEYGGGGGRK